MTETGSTAQETLQRDILASGIDDFVSMADVQALIINGDLADSVAESQRLVLGAVRSLLTDGLIVVGDIPGRNDPGFKPWSGTIDEVMTQFTDVFVGHYDDRLQWEYRIWMNLTPAGEGVASSIAGGND